MAKQTKEEKAFIARYGPPSLCPNCGHDVFSAYTETEVEVKLFWNGCDSEPLVVADRGMKEPELGVTCCKCGKDFSLEALGPDEEEEEEEEE